MTVIFARRARLSNGWASNVSITVNDGRISEIIADSAPAQGAFHADTLLPALSNLHSHSFQRAMAGMTEYKSGGRDSFWTWRDLMYRFAQAIRPEEVEAIAALVFMEMLEAGYAAVGEFHYLHHQPGGAPYAALDELSQRIFAAAAQTGVGLTHLPVLYIYGGAGKKPPSAEQARFCNDVDRFNRLVETARGKLPLEDSAIGIARIRFAQRRPTISRLRSARIRAGRFTSISPSSRRKLTISAPGLARGRSNGCSPMRLLTAGGAPFTQRI